MDIGEIKITVGAELHSGEILVVGAEGNRLIKRGLNRNLVDASDAFIDQLQAGIIIHRGLDLLNQLIDYGIITGACGRCPLAAVITGFVVESVGRGPVSQRGTVGKPAMSITGSGSHGIIAVMPLYAIAECEHYPEDLLLRAAAFSCLITQYIKEYSGRLSALCGCGIAAGTGMACGAAMLRGMSREEIIMVLNHMALGITGMICDGGNHGCAIKCITAVDAAFRAVDMVAHGIEIDPCHGICGSAPEDTMRNIGQIASPGMIGTERVIVEIMAQKLGR